jgi:methyltransferase (TIGR00027 family)
MLLPVSAPLIANVSDTARWVAVYRAWETAQPRPLFRDPFAERLAGERGKQIVAQLPMSRVARNGWPLIARTKVIDDLVLASLAEGCSTVLNLAAGLDTRPYRLDLPKETVWIEVDLPAILEEKARALAGETPVCVLERESVDLADPIARGAFFDWVAAAHPRVLVITEGLVIYLDPPVVASLGRDLAARPAFRYWMLDLVSPRILEDMQRTIGVQLTRAPFKFAPANGVAFFEALGWKVRDVKSLFHEAGRFHRLPWFLRPFSFFPPPDPRAPEREHWSAVVRLERAERG